jgi:predicted Zn-dependent peptidase
MVYVETAVETAHTAQAVKSIVAELSRVRTEPVDEAELARAKSHAADHADERALATLAVSGLPLGYDEDVAARVDRLTQEDVRAAAHRVLATEVVQIAIVGDPDVIAEPLRALGIAEVTVR